MSDIRKEVGRTLKAKLANKEDCLQIAQWAYEMFMEYIEEISTVDQELGNILIILSQMEEGEEFEISEARLNQIADELILGKKNINMDY